MRPRQATSRASTAELAWVGRILTHASSEHTVWFGAAATGDATVQSRYALFPSARQPRYLLPLTGERLHTAAGLVADGPARWARYYTPLLRVGARLRVSPLLLRHRLIVGSAGSGADADRDDLEGYLTRVFEQPVALAASLGYRAPFRTPVVQIMSHDGAVLGYARIGWDRRTRALVRREADALLALGGELGPHCTPTVLDTDERAGRFVLATTGPSGECNRSRRCTAAHIDFLVRLHTADRTQQRLADSRFWRTLDRRARTLAADRRTRGYAALIRRAMHRLERELAGTRLPFGWSHGDFTPGNAKLMDGGIYAYDWERARRRVPPAWDLFHFLLLGGHLADGDANAADAFLVRGEGRERVDQYLRRVAVPAGLTDALLRIHLVDWLGWCFTERPWLAARPGPRARLVTRLLLRRHDGALWGGGRRW